jgi:tetratricopeptide (TPR) repeat protein
MQDCLKRDPYNYQTHVNLAEYFRRQKKWAEARKNLEFVMRYFPDDYAGIYPLLYQVDHELGDPRAANEAVRFGLRMFPDNSDLQRLRLLL